jgi:hypothetical protein
MARRAQMTLDTVKAVKPNASPPIPPARDADAIRRGQTLRLSVAAWKQLKQLALDEEKTAHDLLLEAVNLLFTDRRLPPVA